MEELFKKICNNYKLGSYINCVEIIGGLTNKMYKLVTNTGEFAIKIINPDYLKYRVKAF